ncbi:MAG: response regulator transcription factor [Bacteroidia bacterium]|nr:response regulator transcription factor [Bacteroidia bacterium]
MMNQRDTIRVLVVDDEANSRNLMEMLLRSFSDLEVLGSADSAETALPFIRAASPDLIFLDISMPGKDGFDLIGELQSFDKIPDIIFVTAFDQFAVQAFKVSAFDYLLKPIDFTALEQTLRRYRKHRSSVQMEEQLSGLLRQITNKDRFNKICIPTRTGFVCFASEEIVYLQAEGSYTRLKVLSGEEHLIPNNIGKVETILPDNGYARLGRSLVVNLNYVAGFDRKQKTITLICDDLSITLSVPVKALKILESWIR